MIKVKLLFSTFIAGMLLTGCASVNDFFASKMLEDSGVLQSENYIEYQKEFDAGNLDQDGYFLDVEEAGENISSDIGSVQVSFANNSNLDVRYYTDEAHNEEITDSYVYLFPGDNVYAEVEIDRGVVSSEYEFSKFLIYEYDEDGNRIEREDLEQTSSGNGIVFTAPEEINDGDFAVEPVGEYRMRTLSLKAVCENDDESVNEVSGTWFVNDKQTEGNDFEINPMMAYIISYKYEPDEYFFISSEPSAYYSNNDEGVIIFEQKNPTDETEDYSVVLHKYITVKLTVDKDRKVKIGEENWESYTRNATLPISSLKYGQVITVETDSEWKSLENNKELICINTETRRNGDYIYTLFVPEKGGEFEFNPEDYTYEHGEIIFKCFGSEVKSIQKLAKGSKIYYEQKEAEEGYWLEGKDNYIIVGDEEETIEALKNIHFSKRVEVNVSLPQPKYGGSIIYKVDGKVVTNDSVSKYSGEIIEMSLNHWEGWILKNNGEGDTAFYTVTNNENQEITVNGKNIDDLFEEDVNHQPQLTVILGKNVGTDMELTISAANDYKAEVQYGGGWTVQKIIKGEKYDIFDNSQVLISGDNIGTAEPIQLSMQNKAVQSGKAVKIVITKTSTDGQKDKEVRYVDDIAKKVDPIYIYSPDEIADAKVWYKSISIEIDVVEVEKFSSTSAKANSKLTVRTVDTDIILKDGDLVEKDQKVVATITPDNGFYVSGKNVSNDIYQKTMKYASYLKDIDSIVDEHDIKKYINITLDESDTYATYKYKLDSKEVSGVIRVKEGQKLELTYEITDDSHKMKEKTGGIPVLGIGASYTKVTKTISISHEYDGKTITKFTFGIEVE